MNMLGGSFVEKVLQHWWPQYSWQKFFWFNASYFVIMIASVVAYDLRGESWLILPLAWVIERLCNGFWHVWWTIPRILAGSGKQHPHLDGLVFHRPLPPVGEGIVPQTLWGAVLIGLLAAAFLAFYIPLVKGRMMRAKA